MDNDPRVRLAATESKLEAKAEAAKAEEALLNKRCAGSVGSAHGVEITAGEKLDLAFKCRPLPPSKAQRVGNS